MNRAWFIAIVKSLSDALHRSRTYPSFKRAFDYVLAFVAAIVAFPFMLTASAVIALLFKGNPFYTQRRALTLEGKVFTIIKFRTMPVDTPPVSHITEIFSKNAEPPHIPAFCYWLRKTGLDELPQVFNILKGDMSFIGPRPLSVDDLTIIRTHSPESYAQRKQLSSLPGISGFWQIFGDRNGGIRNLIKMDAMYEQKKSLLFDLYLMIRTLPVMLFADHSDAIFGGSNTQADEDIAEKGNSVLRSVFL